MSEAVHPRKHRHAMLLVCCLAVACLQHAAATTAVAVERGEALLQDRSADAGPSGRVPADRRRVDAAVAAAATAPQPARPTADSGSSGTSVALTAQIALIVLVMVLVAAWPFRRGRTRIGSADDGGRSSRDGPPPDRSTSAMPNDTA